MLQGLSLAFSMGTYVGLLSHGVGGFVCATSYAAPSWRHVFYMGKLGAGFFFFFLAPRFSLSHCFGQTACKVTVQEYSKNSVGVGKD